METISSPNKKLVRLVQRSAVSPFTQRPHWHFTGCPSNTLYGKRVQLSITYFSRRHESLNNFNLREFSPFLVFMTLTFFKIATQLFCRMSLHLGLPMIRSRSCIFGQTLMTVVLCSHCLPSSGIWCQFFHYWWHWFLVTWYWPVFATL